MPSRPPVKRTRKPLPPPPKPRFPPWVLFALGTIITVVWLISMYLRLTTAGYPTPPVVDALMLAVATAAFGGAVLRNGGGR